MDTNSLKTSVKFPVVQEKSTSSEQIGILCVDHAVVID